MVSSQHKGYEIMIEFCGICSADHDTNSPCIVAKIQCTKCKSISWLPFDALTLLGSGNGFCGCGADDRHMKHIGDMELPKGHEHYDKNR